MTKISAVIPDDLGAALKERARVEDRSVGAVVRRSIAAHVLPHVGPVESGSADRRSKRARRTGRDGR